nr:protein PIN-LIKES 2 [Tanacetum cinerariifolium]
MQEEIFSAAVPLLKLLSLTVMGLILAHDKIQIIPRDTFKLLSKLVFALFLPCLIFIDLGRSVTLENITLWWFIPVNVVISMVIGFVLGVIVMLVCRPPPEFVRLTIVTTMCGNMGNLPIAILGSLCHSRDNPFGKDCLQRGVAEPLIAKYVQDDEERQARETRTEGVRSKLVQKIRVVAEKTPIKNIFQPPIIASLLAKVYATPSAVLLGAVARMRGYAVSESDPLHFCFGNIYLHSFHCPFTSLSTLNW